MDPALFLSPHERGNPHTHVDAHQLLGTAWSTGNTVRPIVHGAAYFAELHERVSALVEGDLLYFVDWRGDPYEQLTGNAEQTVSATFAAAAGRGVDVRGLLWRSHWRAVGFHSRRARLLGVAINDAGGQCTYYATLSIFPALIAVLSLLGVVGQSQKTIDAVMPVLGGVVGEEGASTLEPRPLPEPVWPS